MVDIKFKYWVRAVEILAKSRGQGVTIVCADARDHFAAGLTPAQYLDNLVNR